MFCRIALMLGLGAALTGCITPAQQKQAVLDSLSQACAANGGHFVVSDVKQSGSFIGHSTTVATGTCQP